MSGRVVIVGGGVVGLCSAYYARKQGFEVTVLEREEEAHHGCSWGNAGLIVPSHFVPLAAPGMVGMGLKMMLDSKSPFSFNLLGDWSLLGWAKQFAGFANSEHVWRTAPLIRDLNLVSKKGFEELGGVLGDSFGFQKSGLVVHCLREETWRHEQANVAAAQEMGLEAEIWTQEMLAAKETGVRSGACGAVFFADDGMITPGLFLDALTKRLKEDGVEIRYGQTAEDWVVRGGRVAGVRTGADEVTGDEFVLASGTWSRGLAEKFGLDLPLVPGKGYSFSVEGGESTPKYPALLVEARVAVTPMTHGVRFAGTMELGSWSGKVKPGRLAGIKRSIPKYLTDFTADRLKQTAPVWGGLRPCLPDGLPAIGRISEQSNLVIATGHAMMGLSLGPVTGRLVGELLARKKPILPVHALAPGRFGK